MNKKGQLNNLIVFIVALFVIIITIFIIKTIFINFNDLSEGTPLGQDQVSQDLMNQFEDTTFQGINNFYMILFAGLMIVMVVMAFAVRTHPLFFPIAIFVVMPIMMLIAVIFTNAYNDFALNENFTETLAKTALPDLIMGNLPIYVFGFGVVLMVVLYGLNRAEGL